jgi:hypothetical protein
MNVNQSYDFGTRANGNAQMSSPPFKLPAVAQSIDFANLQHSARSNDSASLE